MIGRVFSHYRIISRLGEGGMGVVYLARDERLDRDVALKFLPPEFEAQPERLARFTREAKLLASLNHPHISIIHGLENAEDGSRFLVLERVQGETLADRLRRGAMPVPEALHVCGQIASALEAAHECGVIHRDLKPANVMLTSRGTVKVLDFGLARRAKSSGVGDTSPGTSSTTPWTEPGHILGTPGYMSPEQVRGERQDRRVDIFAFGCVLFECLAGERAFAGSTAVDAMAAALRAEPSWSALPSGTPHSIRKLLARCLEKDPEKRLSEIGDARVEIEEASAAPRTEAADASATPHNLPRALTSFVGRRKELSECRQLLEEAPLLTLTGVGGCGKTRLALRLAEGLLESYPDGVWFVDLAPLSGADRLLPTIATVLSLPREPEESITEILTQRLAGKRALLILDNCEHVLAACATLAARLLRSIPELRLLATSREALGIQGERFYPVRSLPLPPPSADLRAVENSEAVRLFVDRARTADPGFALTEETASGVAEICRRLDGIPFAIELAAARVKVLSIEQIRTRLDDRFRLLTTGDRSALPRQQTLRGTIQWSYDLLGPEERRFFRQLAVHAGSWTLDSSIAAAGDQANEFEILDLTTRLVEKSLLVAESESGRGIRYRMLETVRQYAQDALKDSGEEDQVRARHLDFYLALAEEARGKLFGRDRTEWIERLDRELENLLSAHAYCDRADGGAEKGLRLVVALRGIWYLFGLAALGQRVTEEALGRRGVEPRTRIRAVALGAAGEIACRRGMYAEAETLLKEGIEITRSLDDLAETARMLLFLGIATFSQGERAGARRFLEESIAVARAIGSQSCLAFGLNSLAEQLRESGQLERAAAHYEEAAAIYRRSGDLLDLGVVLLNLVRLDVERSRFSPAEGKLLEALALALNVASKPHETSALEVTAGFLAASGEFERAAILYGACEAALEKSGARRTLPDETFLLPLMASARARLGDSAFSAAYETGRSLSAREALAEARASLEGSGSGTELE